MAVWAGLALRRLAMPLDSPEPRCSQLPEQRLLLDHASVFSDTIVFLLQATEQVEPANPKSIRVVRLIKKFCARGECSYLQWRQTKRTGDWIMATRWGVQNAIISGGASGIGLAMAKALAADGSNIVVLDLKAPKTVIAQISAERKSDTQKVMPFEVDISDAPGVRNAVAKAVEELGMPDFALNCAGVQYAGNFAQIPDDKFAMVINVNLLGSRNFAFAVLPYMQSGCQLGLLASMGGMVTLYGYSAYSASKFGVVGLGEVLRSEYKPLGIGISIICPPEIPTPMVEEEKKNQHPVAAKLKETSGVVTLEELVPYTLDQTIKKKRGLVIPGKEARLTYHATRLIPRSVFNWYTDTVTKSVLKKNPQAPLR
jgi:NAD(P)-dependent dehydrogenase (short-subunit alcohol dehydrogenase family)